MRKAWLGVLAVGLGGTAWADPKPPDPKQDAVRQQAIDDARKAGLIGAKPPQEVTDMAKIMTGTWKCDGTMKLPDGTEQKFKATMKTAADVNGRWIHESMSGVMGGTSVKLEAYMTADAGKWKRISIDSFGGHTMGTSDGMTDQKMDWLIESNTGEKEKAHLDVSDPKKGLHVWSERSSDKGKTWSDGPDLVCKK